MKRSTELNESISGLVINWRALTILFSIPYQKQKQMKFRKLWSNNSYDSRSFSAHNCSKLFDLRNISLNVSSALFPSGLCFHKVQICSLPSKSLISQFSANQILILKQRIITKKHWSGQHFCHGEGQRQCTKTTRIKGLFWWMQKRFIWRQMGTLEWATFLRTRPKWVMKMRRYCHFPPIFGLAKWQSLWDFKGYFVKIRYLKCCFFALFIHFLLFWYYLFQIFFKSQCCQIWQPKYSQIRNKLEKYKNH